MKDILDQLQCGVLIMNQRMSKVSFSNQAAVDMLNSPLSSKINVATCNSQNVNNNNPNEPIPIDKFANIEHISRIDIKSANGEKTKKQMPLPRFLW